MNPLVTAARKYLGVPFRHRGRLATRLDCVGLIVRSMQDIGREVKHDKTRYGREPHADGLREHLQMEFGQPAPDIQVGDVALIAYNTEIPHHVGIIGDYLYGGFSLIHADGSVGHVVEHRIDDNWRKMILETYRDNG
jgi:cell wall-associated NlpC family hydrolase